ncbi:hypothetical protein HELRODRAFT_161733 [Helobdella robusta]|uniref:CUB domain-containing protein n=1 Tax=Helobdella robusta TaxID=6412 RepID=T1ERU7_HELRO|nr:hypothetical protein HELRODRAFT_161733 [Helobdella robusta]ESO02462.1 hypothetical protein HELRODRAFT_161733 [Helobdella robusta]
MNILIINSKCCLLVFILCRICHLKENCTTIKRSGPNHKTGILKSQANESYQNNIRCYYYFEALPDERVELNFTVFDVNGVPPRCLHDFIDIYTQLDSLNVSLLDVPSQGRYCGKDKENLPYLIISVKNIALVDFHTDSSGDGKGFELIYRFFSDAIYKVGTKLQQYLCGFLISDLKEGTILSPTYPGIYPDNIMCFYKFQGEVGERIKLTFNDIDLYSGGNYCPFDHIKIYDGPNNEAHVIDTICGSRKVPIAFYSNGNYLQIFTVGESDETPSQLRGFNASFEIGTRFVDLSLVTLL